MTEQPCIRCGKPAVLQATQGPACLHCHRHLIEAGDNTEPATGNRRPIHEALDLIRQLHCDRRDEGHECAGRMTILPGKRVHLECHRCGPLELTHDGKTVGEILKDAAKKGRAPDPWEVISEAYELLRDGDLEGARELLYETSEAEYHAYAAEIQDS